MKLQKCFIWLLTPWHRQKFLTKLIITLQKHHYYRTQCFISIMNTHHLTSFRVNSILVVFRLSPCLECSLCSFGNFPGVWSTKADVSELNVGSIVLGNQDPDRPGWWNRHWVPKHRLLYFRRRGNSQKNIDWNAFVHWPPKGAAKTTRYP